MKMFVEIPDLSILYDKADGILARILPYWEAAGPPLTLPPSHHLYHFERTRDLAREGHYFLVQRGRLNYVHNGKNVFYYGEGDLVGVLGENDQEETQILSAYDEDPAELVPYSWQTLSQAFAGNPDIADMWLSYLQTLFQIFVTAEESRTSILPKIAPKVVHFEAGETIIKQGDKSTCAYYILKGRVSSYSNGVQVGTVPEGQLVGHMGILMQENRTAQIVADAPCDLLMVAEEELFSLLQVRPDLCKQLFKEMAQKINELNQLLTCG